MPSSNAMPLSNLRNGGAQSAHKRVSPASLEKKKIQNMPTILYFNLSNRFSILPMVELNKLIPLVHNRCFSNVPPTNDLNNLTPPVLSVGTEEVVSLEAMLSCRALAFDFDISVLRLRLSG